MNRYGRLLAPILVIAVAGCGSGGGSVPTPPTTRDEAIPAADQPRTPTPAAAGTLAYIVHGDVYVADPDGSNAIKIADGRPRTTAVPPAGSRSGRRDRCGRRTGGTSPIAAWTVLPRTERGEVVISDAAGNVHATFPADGWDIGWSPDSTRVAVWDTLFETVGVYGVDGARQAQIAMPSEWQPSGDHDPAWLRDGTLAVDGVELPLDGGAPGYSRGRSARVGCVCIAARISPDGSHTASAVAGR